MASVAVIEHVLRKISAAFEQKVFEKREDLRNEMNTVLETLEGFKTHVERLQKKADLGEESNEQTEWRKRAVSLAYLVEDFVDLSTHLHDGFLVYKKLYIRKLNKRMVLELEEIHREIAVLTQHQPQPQPQPPYNTIASAPESSGSPADGYDPCLPLSAAEAELIGEGLAREKLANLLLDGEKSQKVVSIVGFAGLGKTTMAVKLYRQVEAEFECCATASVSWKPDMKKLLQHLLSQLRPEAPQILEMSLDLQQLIEEIREHLQDKRYLILLDDMWESSSGVERALPENNCGSRIIVTTRKRGLSYLGPRGSDGVVLEMERLGLAESERLLSSEIYGSRDWCPDRWWEDSQETARTYDGVPLATVAIGRLVKQRLFYRDFRIQTVPELEQARERILLSYVDLDPCLKAHMMLLCMFPWDFHIDRKLLARIWKAEGYAARPEDILEKLIDRNAILPVKHEDMSQVEAWKVYYEMFEEILLCAAKDDFLITSSNLYLPTTKMVRRLALHSSNGSIFRRLEELDLGFISSLSIFWYAEKIVLNKFKNLRVLDILGWEHMKDNDLYPICDMVLLRYLSLRNTRVENIPPKIENLRCLETLDLRKTRVKGLPSQVGQLPKLSDLLVGSNQNPWSRVKIPTGFRYFRSLQTLEVIHLGDAWLLLNGLPHLKEIGIMCPSLQESSYSQDKLCQSLKHCHGLETLTFYGVLGCSMEFLNGSLNDRPPTPSISNLRVTGKLVKIPPWIATLQKLTLLEITVCQLPPGDLHPLGELPRLQRLLLALDLLPEQEVVITGFLDLERFSLDCRVPWVAFQQGAMPRLTELELKFREGPANQDTSPSGIYHLLNLKRVAMYFSSWCQDSPSVKATVRAMVTKVREHRYPVKLVVNGSLEVEAFT